MPHENIVVSKVPRPSRFFQMGIIHNIDSRFQELAQISCFNDRFIKKKICQSKALLLDIRHIILYQSFDHDIREKLIIRADSILHYIHSYMDTIQVERNVSAMPQLSILHG